MTNMRLFSFIFAVVAALATTASRAADTVGEVSMVIGVGRLTAADGPPREIARGTAVRAGDRIETEAGGHVHIRFVDGALVSVRPLSRLQIEDYRRAAGAAADSAIRFRLDQGVIRSVTGRWGEEARNRFRLNTPIAAIGIKGTDFVVKVDGERTLASVFSGAIVMAPLDGDCKTSLGPCQVDQARVLSAEMLGKMLELSRQQGAPVLVPSVDLLARSRSGAERPLSAPSYEATNEKLAASESRAADSGAAAATAAGTVANQPPVTYGQLSWARFNWAQLLPGDAFSRSLDDARKAGHEPLLGNFSYVLAREGGDALFKPADTAASFNLTQSAAQLVHPGGQIEAVQAGNGVLHVDFANAAFATQLELAAASIGTTTLSANGIIQSNGIFRSTAGNGFVAGAFSMSSREAGYLFERVLPQGNLNGVTLWRR